MMKKEYIESISELVFSTKSPFARVIAVLEKFLKLSR